MRNYNGQEKTSTNPCGAGRSNKLAEIDWEYVESLAECGNSIVTIAKSIGIHRDTLYKHIRDVYDMTASEFSSQFKEKGITNIKRVQYEKAVIERDNSMLIWLGKNLCGQSDKPKEEEKSKAQHIEFRSQIQVEYDSRVKENS